MPGLVERAALIEVIKEILESQGLEQGELSVRCGKHRGYIHQILKKRRKASFSDMPVIARGARLTELELYARMWARRDGLPKP